MAAQPQCYRHFAKRMRGADPATSSRTRASKNLIYANVRWHEIELTNLHDSVRELI
jgi:hypothetical protein